MNNFPSIKMINKIPLEYNVIYPEKKFKSMETLYLELFENKEKINKKNIYQNLIIKNKPRDKLIEKNKDYDKNKDKKKNKKKDKDYNIKENKLNDEDKEKNSLKNSFENSLQNSSENSLKNSSENSSKNYDKKSNITDVYIDSDNISNTNSDIQSNENKKKYDSESDESDEDDKSDESDESDESEESIIPPTYDQIVKNKNINNNSKYISEDQEEINSLLFKYEVLKKMHPNKNIPTFSSFSDINKIRSQYDLLTKKLSLETSVDNWKRYMIIFIMITEVSLGKMKFDMEGFSLQQLSSLSSYDHLLIEIAEKNYNITSIKWSAELRLMFMLIVNTVIFIVGKKINKESGLNIGDLLKTKSKTIRDP